MINSFYFADNDGYPLQEINLGKYFRGNVGDPKVISIKPANGVILNNISLSVAGFDTSNFNETIQNASADILSCIEFTTDPDSTLYYKNTISLGTVDTFYMRSNVPQTASNGDYLFYLKATATCTLEDNSTTIETISILVIGAIREENILHKNETNPVNAIVNLPNGTFELESYNDEDSMSDGTSTFEAVIMNKGKDTHIFTGEDAIFKEQYAGMERIFYKGIINLKGKDLAPGSQKHTIKGKGYDQCLINNGFTWNAGASNATGYDSSVPLATAYRNDVTAQGESDTLNPVTFNWSGYGGVYILPSTDAEPDVMVGVDDQIVITANGKSLTFTQSQTDANTNKDLSDFNAIGPIRIDSILNIGENTINVTITDVYGDKIGCSDLYIVQCEFPAETIINAMLSNTDINYVGGVDLSGLPNISNNINDFPSWSGSWDTIKEALDDFFMMISMALAKVVDNGDGTYTTYLNFVVWWVDDENNLRTYEVGVNNGLFDEGPNTLLDETKKQAIKIYKDNPRLMTAYDEEDAQNIITRVTAFGDNISNTARNLYSENGWIDKQSGLSHPGYGIIVGSDYSDSSITDMDVLRLYAACYVNRQSYPHFNLKLRFSGLVDGSKGQPIMIPDNPEYGEMVFIISKKSRSFGVAAVYTDIEATTDPTAVGSSNTFSTIQSIARTAVQNNAAQDGKVISTDKDGNQVIQLVNGDRIKVSK